MDLENQIQKRELDMKENEKVLELQEVWWEVGTSAMKATQGYF